jgi:hypothetical protein
MPARILTIDIYDFHTQADKIDHLMYKKNNYINYNFLQLTIAIKATIPGTLCRLVGWEGGG